MSILFFCATGTFTWENVKREADGKMGMELFTAGDLVPQWIIAIGIWRTGVVIIIQMEWIQGKIAEILIEQSCRAIRTLPCNNQ